MDSKRSRGEYYTKGNPFTLPPFLDWARDIDLSHQTILEPFAGANHIIKSLQGIELCNDFVSYDIRPNDDQVKRRDTIKRFPRGFEVCITNPPWLARNSATRRGLLYPRTDYDDLYKLCLDLCLQHCPWVAALVPASCLHSNLFRDRLETYILLHDKHLFIDTDNPVCLALFGPRASAKVKVYYDDAYIGELTTLETMIPNSSAHKQVKFNDEDGRLGFVAFDNTIEPSIRFCDAQDIRQYPVKESSRFFSRISVAKNDYSIDILNANIKAFREETQDLFLTPFKGIRRDGQYRRRMSFALAKRFINAA